ncbi:hypothetical protein Pint_36424 [Pistacia integerrima]|uniref:Uncharacterized protein n=1 Tax=Pistacia integerrima TaxID=434235 RepID=A0ACC0Y294_9ROSI|nr:hypothetical protein Pint_36424 [Pistacia integerrima]
MYSKCFSIPTFATLLGQRCGLARQVGERKWRKWVWGWWREKGGSECGDTGEEVTLKVQASSVMEDHSQVEIRRDATFLGVYGSHGGPEASPLDAFVRSPFIVQCIVCCLHMIAKVLGCILGVDFPGVARDNGPFSEDILRNSLGVSNKLVVEQLARDHSPFVEVRQELKSLHPDDSDIVVLKHGVWRVRGILHVSRTIGDAYFKQPDFFGASP